MTAGDKERRLEEADATHIQTILDDIRAESLPAFSVGLVDIFAGALEELANLEERHGISVASVASIGNPQVLAHIIQDMEPEAAGRLFKFLIQLAPLGDEAEKIFLAPPPAKVAFAKKLRRLVANLEAIANE